MVEPDDGRHGGWSHAEFGRALGEALGRKVATLSMSRPILDLFAKVDRWVRGPKAKLTADRVAYFCHPDWVVTAEARPPEQLWTPSVRTPSGLKATAEWYRAQGWIK